MVFPVIRVLPVHSTMPHGTADRSTAVHGRLAFTTVAITDKPTGESLIPVGILPAGATKFCQLVRHGPAVDPINLAISWLC